MGITKSAKNVVFAAVGAGDAAVKTAKELPKRVRGIGSFATGVVRDASKRFDRYVLRGKKVVGRNGATPKPKSRTTKVKAAPADTPVVTTVVDARSADVPGDVPADLLG